MKNPLTKTFWALIATFILIVSWFTIQALGYDIARSLFPVLATLGLIFLILGVLLIYHTVKQKVKGPLKIFLILTGAAPPAAFLSAILHNLVYGLMIVIFGIEFWGPNGDEAFFFMLALIVFPIVFVIGVIGSLWIMFRKKK